MIIGLFTARVIHRREPWRRLDGVEYATLEWVDWFNNRRCWKRLATVSGISGAVQKHQFAAVCVALYLGDGCECTYSQVSVNRPLRSIACSFRSGADGSFATTSVVIGFVGSVVATPP